MTKRKLPIGIQTFREVREDNCYYVDKTAYLHRLLDEGKVARANRDLLRGLYSTVKFADAHIRFTFLTGVGKSWWAAAITAG